MRRYWALALGLALVLAGCQQAPSRSGAAVGAPPRTASPLRPDLEADVRALLSEGKPRLAAEPRTREGAALKGHLQAFDRSQAAFDRALESSGVGRIANSELLGTPGGRKRAREMLATLRRTTHAHYEAVLRTSKDLGAWWKAGGKADLQGDDHVLSATELARKRADETFEHVDEWIDLLDRINPKYDPKQKALQMKGMQKGLDYDKLAREINHHTDAWARQDLEALTARQLMLQEIFNRATGQPVPVQT